MDRFKALCVTGLGTGYLPIAPGTWGSAAVAGLYLLIGLGSGCSVGGLTIAMGVVLVLSCILCVAFGPFAERQFGKKDPGQVTIDEFAGQAVALMFLPVVNLYLAAGVAFLAFRVFDILKPPPARQLEKLPQGWGVLADDLAAGVYANIACQVLLRLVG